MISTYDRIQTLYEKLQDDESRRVFSLSVQKSVPGCPTDIYGTLLDAFDFKNPHWNAFADEYGEEFHRLKEAQQNGMKLIFYPAGSGMYPDANHLFERFGITVDYASDRDAALWGKTFYGAEVLSPEEMLRIDNKTVVLISVNPSIREWLAENGICGEILCDIPREYALFSLKFGSYYFPPDFLPSPAKGSVYVDCGVFDGADMKGYAEYTGMQYGQIIGFEPDKQNVAIIRKNLQNWGLSRVKLLEKAVSERNGILGFSSLGTGSKVVSSSDAVKVEAASIDSVLDGGRADFIKMDIEGAEMSALRGAEKTILRYKPILAVSVYHKPEDIFEIPEYLLSLVPEYKLYLRNYALGACDNILYAII